MLSIKDLDFTYTCPIYSSKEGFEVRYNQSLLFSVDYDTDTHQTELNFSKSKIAELNTSIPLSVLQDILILAKEKFENS